MAATGQIADPELANAFAELSMKKVQAENQIRLSNGQIESLSRKIQHSQLVELEVKNLPEDVKVFKAVGRMFLLQSSPEIKDDLEKKKDAFATKIKELESKKKYLQQNIEDCKDNVRELVMNKKSAH